MRRPKACLRGEILATSAAFGNQLNPFPSAYPHFGQAQDASCSCSLRIHFAVAFGMAPPKNDRIIARAVGSFTSSATHKFTAHLLPTMTNQPCGVHLVGSIAAQTSEEAFLAACNGLPGRLRRVPDGETGERCNFVGMLRDRIP